MNYEQFPKFINFCQAQERFEGGNKYSDTNPANIRCIAGQRNGWHHLAINQGGNFCIFPDRATGILAHYENIYNICIGASKTYNNEGKRLYNVLNCGDLTIEQMISIYAPSTDGNSPIHYATVLCLWANLKTSDTMKSLLDNNPSSIIPKNGQQTVQPVQNSPIMDNRTTWQRFLDWLIEFFGKTP